MGTGAGAFSWNSELPSGRNPFWIRDEAFLRAGPRLGVDRDYFEMDGAPLAVVGTTYMSSEVQRLYFDHPNVFVWERDLAQIHAALAYYYDHKEQIDAEIVEGTRYADEMRAKQPNRLSRAELEAR